MVPTCSSDTLTTQECHGPDTGHDTPPRHSTCIQTQGQPVVVLSIDVELHTGI